MEYTDIKQKIEENAALTEAALEGYCQKPDKELQALFDSEAYSLLGGGKRIRPFIVNEVCAALGGDIKASMPFAAALEMIHTYSLIHDDLPCMDDDDMRRGKPTNHKVYGYSTALLAGDALLTKAFAAVVSNEYVEDRVKVEAVRLLSEAAGECGMIGGQIIDLSGEGKKLTYAELLRLHKLKTGALIRCGACLGALAAGYGADTDRYREASEYAEKIGLVFQVIDDILDATATVEEIGKSVGSDAERNKTTFLTYYSLVGAKAYAEGMTEGAIEKISSWDKGQTLAELARYLLDRKY